MQKVYILLRNNQQNGPYSLEEILQFDLKPVDLIWIEGKSAGWYYPQEIAALTPYLPFVKKEAAPPAQAEVIPSAETAKQRNVFVAMPAAFSAPEAVPEKRIKKEDPPVKETFQAVNQQSDSTEKGGLKTGYSRSLEEVESDYTSWMYNQKRRKKRPSFSRRGIAAALLVTGVASAAWQFLKPEGLPAQEAVAQAPAASGEAQAVDEGAMPSESVAGITPAVKKNFTQNKKNITAPKEPKREKAPAITEIIKPVTNAPEENEYEPPTITKEEKAIAAEEKTSPPVIAEAPKEQKKKLREKILDIFKKKKEEPRNEESRPADEENGERRATRREGSATLSTQVTVKFEVPNDWMMGIKGAKAVVTNRSTQTLTKALIEVTYYNGDSEVLQTKTFSVGNLSAKKTVAVSIPDHPTAERLEYKIISVQGAAEPFARL